MGTFSVGIKGPAVSSVEKFCSVVDWKLGVVMQTSTGTPSCKTISQFGLAVIKVKLAVNNGSGVVIESDVIQKGLELVTGSEVVVITVVEDSVVAVVAGIAVVLLCAVEMMGGRVEIVVELGVVVVVLAVVGEVVVGTRRCYTATSSILLCCGRKYQPSRSRIG